MSTPTFGPSSPGFALRSPANRHPLPHVLAWVLCGATVLLLTAGALVTSTGSSLAVPDWPLAYGQVFPPMVGGILYEHGHRMVATTVGMLTILLLAALLWREPRPWVRWLGLVALLVVIAQGVLGGLTVIYLLPKPISISHAVLAQLFFLLTVTLVQVTSPHWPALVQRSAPPGRLPLLAGALALLALLTLVLGATVRHFNAGLAIPDFPLAYGRLIPPLGAFPIAIHFAHRAAALLVTLGVVWAVVWVWRSYRAERALLRPAMAAALLLPLQILLGGAVVWSQRAVPITTLHLVNGALLLAAVALLWLRAWLLVPRPGRGAARPRRCPPTPVGEHAMSASHDTTAAPARPADSFLADVAMLVKPRITAMVLVATAVGFVLAPAAIDWARLLWTLVATLFLSCANCILNQVLERDVDGLMPRTRNRPLPSGRMTTRSVLLWGAGLSVLSLGMLWWRVNLLSAGIGLAVLVTYVFLYTPLKRVSVLNTLVGAVPGALPPVLGWAAAVGTVGHEAAALFLIIFVWQPPHVLAIDWMYRDDYAAAGMPMLTVVDPSGQSTRRQLVVYTLTLIPVTLYPAVIGMVGDLYFYGALVLGLLLLVPMAWMAQRPTVPRARVMLRATVIYLPLLLGLLVYDALTR